MEVREHNEDKHAYEMARERRKSDLRNYQHNFSELHDFGNYLAAYQHLENRGYKPTNTINIYRKVGAAAWVTTFNTPEGRKRVWVNYWTTRKR